MAVFHYCAERLKDVPLFESCSDESLGKLNDEGALYNDFDGNVSLLDMADFQPSQSFEYNLLHGECSSSTTVSHADIDIDSVFLQADDDDHTLWEILAEDFEKDLPTDNIAYIEKVYHLVNNPDEFEEFLHADHIER